MKEPINKIAWLKKHWIIVVFMVIPATIILGGVIFAPPEKHHHKIYQPVDHSDSTADQPADHSETPADPDTNIFYNGSYHYIMSTPNAYIYRAEIPGTNGGPEHSPTVCYITENKTWTNVSDGIYCIPAS